MLVSGPAGVGKSRLAWEFEKYIDGLAEGVFWHRGRCLSYGEGVVFWALTEIVRQRLGIAEEDPSTTVATKLAEGLDTFVPDVAERSYIGPRLGRLLGVTLAGDSGGNLAREELFAGWRLFFERLAETEPVVLLVEDAHYGDTGLLDFVDHLVDWARDAPVFVLVFTRPELEQVRPGFGTGRNRSTLTLDPLDDASMDALIDALVPDMPESARVAIADQAEGIPLFAVETVRSLVDRDIVVPRDGVYRLVGDIGTLSVPDGLRALLAARLDALDPDQRSLLSEAAILGSTFPIESLVAVSAQDEASVRRGLTELLRREVLSISADRLSPQRGDYRFAQDLLRQVAYETMSRRDRKARHLAVAAHLRAVFRDDGEDVAEVISRHYLDALAAVPDAPDVTDIRAQATLMLVRAAERSLRSGAPRAAASDYRAAAQQTELGGDISEAGTASAAAGMWERAARAALTGHDLDGSLEYGERAISLYETHGQARAAARSKALTGEVLRRSGRNAEAREVLVAALDVLRPDADADTVTALGWLAVAETFSGGPDRDEVVGRSAGAGSGIGRRCRAAGRTPHRPGVGAQFFRSRPGRGRPSRLRRQGGRRGRRRFSTSPRPVQLGRSPDQDRSGGGRQRGTGGRRPPAAHGPNQATRRGHGQRGGGLPLVRGVGPCRPGHPGRHRWRSARLQRVHRLRCVHPRRVTGRRRARGRLCRSPSDARQ